MKACKIKVRGRVQGVYFRAHTCTKAKELCIAGTVRNMPDGSVEIEAEGDESKIEHLIRWCHVGSFLANVTSVEVIENDIAGFTGFETIR